MATEKRLVNAHEVEELFYKQVEYGATDLMDAFDDALQDAKTVDAVEVVRCKDCKHCTVTSDGMVCECALPTKRMMDYYIYGSTILAKVEADDFCSHGERRTDG